MGELTLLILRLAFLAVLWAFVFAIVYALRSDLFGQRARRMPAPDATAASPFPAQSPSARPASPTSAPADPTEAIGRDAVPRRLVVTSGPREGMEITLSSDQLTIGRSGESGLVIRDDYTSTHHARLMLWNGQWMVQDLDSTNGTFLAGQRVTVPTPVPTNTPIKIGTTSFELRR